MFFRALTIALFATATSAASICTYNTRTCNSLVYSCCNNIPDNNCCYWGPNSRYGLSTSFSGMPTTNWSGQTYEDQCINVINGGAASRSHPCVIAQSSVQGPPVSAAWFNTAGKQGIEATRVACSTPNVIGFTTEEGARHEVAVPEGQFESMLKLATEKKYDILLGLSK